MLMLLNYRKKDLSFEWTNMCFYLVCSTIKFMVLWQIYDMRGDKSISNHLGKCGFLSLGLSSKEGKIVNLDRNYSILRNRYYTWKVNQRSIKIFFDIILGDLKQRAIFKLNLWIRWMLAIDVCSVIDFCTFGKIFLRSKSKCSQICLTWFLKGKSFAGHLES